MRHMRLTGTVAGLDGSSKTVVALHTESNLRLVYAGSLRHCKACCLVPTRTLCVCVCVCAHARGYMRATIGHDYTQRNPGAANGQASGVGGSQTEGVCVPRARGTETPSLAIRDRHHQSARCLGAPSLIAGALADRTCLQIERITSQPP
jgi:hypothetical protein